MLHVAVEVAKRKADGDTAAAVRTEDVPWGGGGFGARRVWCQHV